MKTSRTGLKLRNRLPEILDDYLGELRGGMKEVVGKGGVGEGEGVGDEGEDFFEGGGGGDEAGFSLVAFIALASKEI